MNIGTGTNVTKTSIRNVHVRGFTNTGSCGLKIGNCLESIFENVYLQSNYDGLSDGSGAPTTLTFIGCQSRTNSRYGIFLQNINSSSFHKFICEGNASDGLHISATAPIGSLDFFGFYSEANNSGGLGTAPIYISSSGVGSFNGVNFWGGVINDAVSGRCIDLDACTDVIFNRMVLNTQSPGFMRVTANTSACTYIPCGIGWGVSAASISGNTVTGVQVINDVSNAGFHVEAFSPGSAQLIGISNGLVVITDRTHNRTALLSLNGSLNTVSILSDPDGGFFNASAAGNNRINVYYSGGYVINNGYGAGVNIVAQILMANHP